MIRKLMGAAVVAMTLVVPCRAQSGGSGRPMSTALRSGVPAGFDIPFSIFARDRRDGVIGEPPYTYNTAVIPVFIGVIRDQSGFTGFLKLSSRYGGPEVITVRPGDSIPGYRGQVESLSLDSLVLSMEGRPQQVVALGQGVPVTPRIIGGE